LTKIISVAKFYTKFLEIEFRKNFLENSHKFGNGLEKTELLNILFSVTIGKFEIFPKMPV